jgi:uncharacterized membrane protein (DUF2068 family)
VSHPSWLKSAGLAVNVLIVLYLFKVVREKNRSPSASAARA